MGHRLWWLSSLSPTHLFRAGAVWAGCAGYIVLNTSEVGTGQPVDCFNLCAKLFSYVWFSWADRKQENWLFTNRNRTFMHIVVQIVYVKVILNLLQYFLSEVTSGTQIHKSLWKVNPEWLSSVHCANSSLCVFLRWFYGLRMVALVHDCDKKPKLCNAVAEIGAVVSWP